MIEDDAVCSFRTETGVFGKFFSYGFEVIGMTFEVEGDGRLPFSLRGVDITEELPKAGGFPGEGFDNHGNASDF